jgi:hypothetical protein
MFIWMIIKNFDIPTELTSGRAQRKCWIIGNLQRNKQFRGIQRDESRDTSNTKLHVHIKPSKLVKFQGPLIGIQEVYGAFRPRSRLSCTAVRVLTDPQQEYAGILTQPGLAADSQLSICKDTVPTNNKNCVNLYFLSSTTVTT